MSTTTSITSTYVGEDAGIYIGEAIKQSNTIKDKLITVLPNVKYKAVLHKLTLSGGTQDWSCDFTPSGSMTLGETVITPEKFQVPFQFCKNDFIETWEAESMGFGADSHTLPSTFQEFFIATVLETQAAAIDTNIWIGSGSVNGNFNGLITQWESDGSTNEVSALTASIDATNVIEYMGAVYDAIPDNVFSQDDMVFVVSTKVSKAYKRALSALGYGTTYQQGDKGNDYEGINLSVLPNAPGNFMAVYQVKNIYFGTGLLSDHNEISIKDMHEVDLSDNIRFKMAYSAAVAYVIPAEITYYYKS